MWPYFKFEGSHCKEPNEGWVQEASTPCRSSPTRPFDSSVREVAEISTERCNSQTMAARPELICNGCRSLVTKNHSATSIRCSCCIFLNSTRLCKNHFFNCPSSLLCRSWMLCRWLCWLPPRTTVATWTQPFSRSSTLPPKGSAACL